MSDELRAGRALDAECARVLGYVRRGDAWVAPLHWLFNDEPPILPYFSSDLIAARLLEDEIERRGLQDEYIRVLLAIVAPDRSTVGTFWLILRATPSQRSRAFLKAVKE